jgi:glucosamine 6-phosphate synthetase-like amidotransferase/phosphosugar isomerase protein
MCGIFGYCSFLKPKVYLFFSFLFDARYRGWLLLDLAAPTKLPHILPIILRFAPMSNNRQTDSVLSPTESQGNLRYCILCNGLAREEYRGYDSAGIGIDGDAPGEVYYFKEVGKVAGLRQRVAGASVDTTKVFNSQVSIAHTRWATHGPPSVLNCHPLRSDPASDFCIVHNGIVTNAAALRLVLQNRGYKFESETDTEAVAILTKYVYDSQPDKRITFTELVKAVLKELEGSFAFVFKSKHYPDEVVTARRGSPLLVGVKTDKKLKVDFVDVEFAGQENDQKITDSREFVNALRRVYPFSDTVFSLAYRDFWWPRHWPPRASDC